MSVGDPWMPRGHDFGWFERFARPVLADVERPREDPTDFPTDWQHNRAREVIKDITNGTISGGARREIRKALDHKEAPPSREQVRDGALGRALGRLALPVIVLLLTVVAASAAPRPEGPPALWTGDVPAASLGPKPAVPHDGNKWKTSAGVFGQFGGKTYVLTPDKHWKPTTQ